MFDDAPEEPRFPLFALPNQLMKDVINHMDAPEVIGFSLISNKTALIVQSFNNTSIPLSVTVNSTVEVVAQISVGIYYHFRFRFYESEDLLYRERLYESQRFPFGEASTEPPKDLYPPGYVRVFWNSTELGTFEKKEFTMRNWMDHISKLFNQPKIELFDYEPEVFSEQSVKETFPKFDQFMIECSNEEYERMMNIFNYCTSIHVGGCEDDWNNQSEIIPKIFIQLFDRTETEINLKISLDNLLICNAQLLTIRESHITNKGLNTFLKCWMKGACPNLKHADLRVYTEKALDLDIVWKGIKRQNAPENRTNMCRTCQYNDFMAFDGGVDIKRYDGIVATILIEDLHGFRGNCDMKIFVHH